MPASWIDLRHETVHGRLPTVKRLELATRDALTWLWENFWVDMEKNGFLNAAEELKIEQPAREELRLVLKRFVGDRAKEVRAGEVGTSSTSASSVACTQLVNMCRGDETALRNMIGEMVQVKVLVPNNRSSVDLVIKSEDADANDVS